MTNTNVTALRKDLFSMLSNTIKYNETINVNTKDGNAVILSEEEYNGMKATLELSSNKKLRIITPIQLPIYQIRKIR